MKKLLLGAVIALSANSYAANANAATLKVTASLLRRDKTND